MNQASVGECNCLIRHAVTQEERAQVAQALGYARAIGDPAGIMLAIAQLTGNCPARNT